MVPFITLQNESNKYFLISSIMLYSMLKKIMRFTCLSPIIPQFLNLSDFMSLIWWSLHSRSPTNQRFLWTWIISYTLLNPKKKQGVIFKLDFESRIKFYLSLDLRILSFLNSLIRLYKYSFIFMLIHHNKNPLFFKTLQHIKKSAYSKN